MSFTNLVLQKTWLQLFSYVLNALKSACSTKGGLDITTLVNDFGAFLTKEDIDKEVTNEEWVLAKSTFELASAFALVKDPNSRKESKCCWHAMCMGLISDTVYHRRQKDRWTYEECCQIDWRTRWAYLMMLSTHILTFWWKSSCTKQRLWRSHYFMECIPPSIYGLRGIAVWTMSKRIYSPVTLCRPLIMQQSSPRLLDDHLDWQVKKQREKQPSLQMPMSWWVFWLIKKASEQHNLNSMLLQGFEHSACPIGRQRSTPKDPKGGTEW